MLYWGQICTVRWPCSWWDVIVCQEILTNSGNMWSGIVMLQNQITLLHKRDCNRTQDLIPISYCGHIARNNNQLWFYPVSNASLDHNGATPKPIPFDNTGVGKAFSATSVHTTSTICAIESEPRLVRKTVSTASSEIAWAHAPSTTP